jgi:excisionase family DNA binding protein
MQQKQAGAQSCSTGLEIPLLSKVPQAAKMMGLHVTTINSLIQRGELKPILKLRHRLIPRSEIERFLNSGGENKEDGAKAESKGMTPSTQAKVSVKSGSQK